MDNNKYISQVNMIGYHGQHALKNAKVLCIGAGSFGSLVISFLAAAGVENLGIIDGEIINAGNLNNQIIYTENDIGKYKVDALKKHLIKLNSASKITAYPYNIDVHNAKHLIHRYDFIVDCNDNFIATYLISDICNSEGKNLVSASVHGFSGEVMTFIAPQTCYRCLFPKVKNILNRRRDMLYSSAAIIASTQANEVIKLITNLKPIQSHMINIDSVLNKMSSYNIAPDTACINHHHEHAANINSNKSILSSTYIKYSDIPHLVNKTNNVIVINMLKCEDKEKLSSHFYPQSSVKIITYDNNIQPIANIQKNHQLIKQDDNIIIVCNFGTKSKILGQMFCNNGYKNVFYTKYAEFG